jgi:hypothetical protein
MKVGSANEIYSSIIPYCCNGLTEEEKMNALNPDKLSFIHLVNENSSILSLVLLFSHIFSATVYVNS